MSKDFLTYQQQISKLSIDKGIVCDGEKSIEILVSTGYFNLINGYKNPFVYKKDEEGKHIYRKGTTLQQIYALKCFEDSLRIIFLKYITRVDEEVRSVFAYAFDLFNDSGKIHWDDFEAYSKRWKQQRITPIVEKANSEISKSRNEYVKHYLRKQEHIPAWILMKAINLSTVIELIEISKEESLDFLCSLYGLRKMTGENSHKLLIASLSWIRKVRNSCAHNERVYDISSSSRISIEYLDELSEEYTRESNKRLIDFIVYMKYYLPHESYVDFIEEIQEHIEFLKSSIMPAAFNSTISSMGIRSIKHLSTLKDKKKEIEYKKVVDNAVCV